MTLVSERSKTIQFVSWPRFSSFHRRTIRTVLLFLPAAGFLALVVSCAIAVIRMSLGERNAEWSTWTVANYVSLYDAFYLTIFANTVLLAAASAVIAVILGLPVALFMARTRSAALRHTILMSVMLPMVINLIVQSYGWMVVLGPSGALNTVLAPLTGNRESTALLFNGAGVLLGLVQTSLPLAVLPMASAFAAIPQDLEEAANVLGASRSVVYTHIILPIAWPSIVAGALLVFAFNVGAFAVPLLLGGLKVTTVGLLIRDEMGTLLNWPLGSALSVVLMAIAMGIVALRRAVVGSRVQ
jgi:putative spermidine/putrescine transport system permease protein